MSNDNFELDAVEELAIANELAVQAEMHNLYKTGNEITEQIISETDPQKLDDLTNLFKANQKKKEIARINKLSNLLELVDDEVITRVTAEPESFKNGEIVSLMNVTQKSIESLNNSLEQVPMIQINNQTNSINLNQDSGLDLASRKRVLDAVRAILDSANSEVVEAEIEEVE